MRHVCGFCGGQSKYCFESCRKDLGFDSKLKRGWDFPGGPVVKTLHFQCRGHGFGPRSQNEDPTCHMAWPKINKMLSSIS